MTAIGADQLIETLRASERLADRGVAHSVVYLLEPGRFRAPCGPREASHLASADVRHSITAGRPRV